MAGIIKIIADGQSKDINLDSFGKDVVSFGRSHECDIQLNRNYVSRVHGCFYKENGCWFFKDLESTNGIYYKGMKKDSAPLNYNDELIIHKRDGMSEAIKMIYIGDSASGMPLSGGMESYGVTFGAVPDQFGQSAVQGQYSQQGMNPAGQYSQQGMNPAGQYGQQGMNAMGQYGQDGMNPAMQSAQFDDVNYEDDESPDEADQFASDKAFLIVGIIVIVLLLAVGGFLFFKFFRNKDDKSDKKEPKTAVTATITDASPTEAQSVETTTEASEKDTEEATVSSEKPADGKWTQDQALQAVRNYCEKQNPYLKEKNDKEYGWTISDNGDGTYEVDFRSYTGSHTYFTVNAETGDVTSEDYIPTVSNERVKGSDEFNIEDYLK